MIKEKQDISFYKNKDIKKNCETVYQADSSKQNHKESSIRDLSLALWIKEVYMPIDRLVYEIISPFSKKLKELSADPYDDYLMNSFCNYIDKKTKKKNRKKIHQIYSSRITPKSVKSFSLNLYHCFSELEDALHEFSIYSQGYVDDYLHDGQEMLNQAKKKRLLLRKEKQHLTIA